MFSLIIFLNSSLITRLPFAVQSQHTITRFAESLQWNVVTAAGGSHTALNVKSTAARVPVIQDRGLRDSPRGCCVHHHTQGCEHFSDHYTLTSIMHYDKSFRIKSQQQCYYSDQDSTCHYDGQTGQKSLCWTPLTFATLFSSFIQCFKVNQSNSIAPSCDTNHQVQGKHRLITFG